MLHTIGKKYIIDESTPNLHDGSNYFLMRMRKDR